MPSVPDLDRLNRHHPKHTWERVLPPGQGFVQLSSPALETNCCDLELSEILDVPPVQSLMNDFFDIAHIPMAVMDIRGKVLAGVGWQEICTDFHRLNPDSCRNCIESDTKLSAGTRPGEYRLYKCKNNMWDIATPLMVRERHVGNIFSGQFFFDDEQIDRELFRAQARQYGFDEQRYLAALEAVPRISRDIVQTGMALITKLAHLVSEISYKNAQMAHWMEERKRSEEALIRSEKLASVGRMAATVAHEINNPLEAVTNCIYLAKADAELPVLTKEHLEVAERELLRVAHITRQTLGFYRENSKPAVVDIAALVHEVSELYGPKLKQRELRLKVEHEGDNTTIAVAGEIRQVVSNLLTNAIDASSPKHKVRIRTSFVTLRACSYIRLTVADAGSGIRKADVAQLFKPFFTTKETVGTGLGLWVSSEIIKKHGGRIRVRSTEGRGTVFSVFLPQQADLTTCDVE